MAVNWHNMDLGAVDAYALAVAGGYTGTKEQWVAEIANASTNASNAEAYAKGTRGGTEVESTDPAYHNNAEYYNGLAQTAKTAAETAAASASAAYGTALLAPNYSSSATYNVGDHVIYSGNYYVCNTAITTAEAWTAEHWTQLTVGGEAASLKSALAQDEEILIDSPYIRTFSIVEGGANTSNGQNNTNANRARTPFLPIEQDTAYLIDLTNTDYCIINTWLYNSEYSGVRAVYSGNSNPIVRRVIFSTSASNEKFLRVTFAKSDLTTNLTSEDRTSIEQALKITIKHTPYTYRGQFSELGYTALSSCVKPGWYGIGVTSYASITDLPSDMDTSVVSYLNVYCPGAGSQTGNPINQEIVSINGKRWVRRIYQNTASDWCKSYEYKFNGYISDLGYTTLKSCISPGWYGLASGDIANLTDLPEMYGSSGGGTLIVFAPTMAKTSNYWVNQILFNTNGKSWWRKLKKDGSNASDWILQGGNQASDKFAGKKVAILGASNDTNGDPGTGTNTNAVEITVTAEDVGVELSAYLTYYDVQAGLSLGGHTYTSSEIGDEVTFTPTSDDIGKMIGRANNYNSNSLKTWWEVAADELGFTPIPVCWSGSSVTSHEGAESNLKTSYAWHDAQIRKCGIRTPGTMERTAPDVIIITRGLNDYGHDPYNVVLTDGYFDDPDFNYPTTDELPNNKYGFMEGLVLTIKKLRAAYPKAQIMLATMKMALRPSGMWSSFPPRNGTNTIIQYSEAFRKVAEYMGCHLLELDKCGITYENFLDNYCIDTTRPAPSHANEAGHKLMGDRAVIDLMKLNF